MIALITLITLMNTSSGLLARLADIISNMFDSGADVQSEGSVWREFMFFNLIVVLVTNFISHTVGAITMMPVIAKVTNNMQFLSIILFLSLSLSLSRCYSLLLPLYMVLSLFVLV